MKKFLILFVFILYTLYSILYTFTPRAQATSVSPFAPFSVEGNPNEDYYFDEIFPLFDYISAPTFEVYENRDMSRNYLHLEVCGGNYAGGIGNLFDSRDYECGPDDSSCDGGDVDWCTPNTNNVVSSGHSGANGCHYIRDKETHEIIDGTCSYKTGANIKNELKGTDFSNPVGLTYPKIQSDSLANDNRGSDDNPITWGSHRLMLDASAQYLNQLVVLFRANQTKETHAKTGEWPLGWVDWGYATPNGKTLLQIYSELPGELVTAGKNFAETQDNFLLNIFTNAPLPTTAQDYTQAVDLISQALDSTSPPTWATDFIQSPIYPPSFRQGYARGSICFFDICCNTARCKYEMEGNHRSLYYDTSISQSYNAAINEFFLTHSLSEGKVVFQKIVKNNQLIRFASSAAIEATPSKIHAKLDPEIKGTCLQYGVMGTWLSFGTYMDYWKPGKSLGPNCPGYIISSGLNKETARATYSGSLSSFIDYLLAKAMDDTVPIKYHLITIPDAMGQAIQELRQPVYDSRDSLIELEKVKDYNANLSNIVDDGADNLLSGLTIDPADARRRWGLYPCNDPMFSAQMTTISVEAYVNGNHVGCDAAPPVPEGKCDGQLFAKLIEGGGYTESSQKGTDYFNTNIKTRLTPELMNTYAAAEKKTGVPCEILAGIHFVEADNNPQGSLVSGRALGTAEPDAGGKVFHSLLDTATYAGEHLKGKVGGNLKNAATAITALSRYNGGGNSNCQSGYPYPIPYGGCPRAFEGEDDPYPTSFLDNKHDSMYLLYCADYTACAPQIFERPGSFTVALNVYNSLTKNGYKNADLPKTQKPSSTTTSIPTTNQPNPGFFPKSCGPQSLSTALGCLPYTRAAFVSTLLSFIVGIAGAIALIIMLVATIQIMTAGDDAKKLQAGKELFTSAIVGLLFLIFSVSLLRLIAGDIIKLPGF